MKLRICWECESLTFPIRLIQSGPDRFTVIYGQQSTTDLNYNHAAHKLGSCLMHALACDGKILIDSDENPEPT
jgi:hypothetical protein